MQQWRAPEDITITFDWAYETDDVTPANDPFGYTVGTDWNGVLATVGNLTNLTQNIVDLSTWLLVKISASLSGVVVLRVVMLRQLSLTSKPVLRLHLQ